MPQKTWTGNVVEENGELLLVFPEEMVSDLGWAAGDTIIWDIPENGNVVIARKARPDELQPE